MIFQINLIKKYSIKWKLPLNIEHFYISLIYILYKFIYYEKI